MSYRRRTGSRTTLVRCGDSRVVGDYEQTADWPSATSLYVAVATAFAGRNSITATGLFDAATSFRYSDLLQLATIDRAGHVGVQLIDFFAAAGLSTSAEVLVVTDRCGDSLALPVRDALSQVDARLTLGTTRAALRHDQGGPIRLDVADWTTASEPMAATSVRALTFEDFVGCC